MAITVASDTIELVVDSGATNSIVNSLLGVVVDELLPSLTVELADGTRLQTTARGTLNGILPVLYIPSFTHNLCSVAAMATAGYTLQITNSASRFVDTKTGAHLFNVRRNGGFYFIDLVVKETSQCRHCSGRTHSSDSCWIQFPAIKERMVRERIAREKKRSSAAAKKEQSEPDFTALYQSTVGMLLWFSRTSRPDIGYSANLRASNSANPSAKDVQEVIALLNHCQSNASEPRHAGSDLAEHSSICMTADFCSALPSHF
jgi:hypothetical protein